MSVQNLRTLLTQLEQELVSIELDGESRRLLSELGKHIDTALEQAEPNNTISPMLETANLLEVEFAAKHPVADKLFRELMDTLVKLGV